jgi:hypothetical protein
VSSFIKIGEIKDVSQMYENILLLRDNLKIRVKTGIKINLKLYVSIY